MTIETFYDFHFRAFHSVKGLSEAATSVHWHSYRVRFWFSESPDQDKLSKELETKYLCLHGANLNKFCAVSTDEKLAEKFLKTWASRKCIKVEVRNDGRKGAVGTL